jgi:hypothetical protein
MPEEHSQTDRGMSAALIHLLKAVLYRDQQEVIWQDMLRHHNAIADYIKVIGLVLTVDESEGYAYLEQRESDGDEEPLPRLVQRRALSYPVSLLCVLLRKRIVEQDAGGGDNRIIISRQQIIDSMQVFLPDSGNEAKTADRISTTINRVVEYGFLRRLKDQPDQFEISRIIKGLLTADWLDNFDKQLESYQKHSLTLAEAR